MTVDRRRIIELLGSGLNAEIVATAVGIAPSNISAMMGEEEFRAEVIALRSENLQANSKRDRNIDAIEDGLIEKIADAVSDNLIYKPNEVLRAFQVINGARRRGVPAHESIIVNNTVVNLQLPPVVKRHFTINQQGEVVGIEDQTLVTMPTHQLLRSLASNGGKDAERYNKVARYLPTTSTIEASGEGSIDEALTGKR